MVELGVNGFYVQWLKNDLHNVCFSSREKSTRQSRYRQPSQEYLWSQQAFGDELSRANNTFSWGCQRGLVSHQLTSIVTENSSTIITMQNSLHKRERDLIQDHPYWLAKPMVLLWCDIERDPKNSERSEPAFLVIETEVEGKLLNGKWNSNEKLLICTSSYHACISTVSSAISSLNLD